MAKPTRNRDRCVRIVRPLALLICATGWAMAATAQQRSPVPIIDAHVHIMPDKNMRFDTTVADALRMMDRFGVVRTLAMSPPRPKKVKLSFDYPELKAALAPYPERFRFLGGGGSLNPTLHQAPKAITDAMKRRFTDTARQAIAAGAIGFGEMSSLHISVTPTHLYGFVPADHPLLLALADVAADLDVPIDLHNDAAVAAMTPPARLAKLPNNPAQFPATIEPLERLLDHNRRARIIWDHGGSDQLGGMTPARIGAMMDRHPNLYMSLRAVGSRAPVKNKLLQTRPPAVEPAWLALLRRHSDRFIIGTDSFYGGPPEFARTTVNRLRAAGLFLSLLPPDLARKIGADNAVRLYHLPPVGELPRQSAGPEKTRKKAGGAASTGKRCKDGNLEHCRKLCQRGIKQACARLE